MAMGYAQVRFAGQGGGHVSMSASDADQDRQIYESDHPFLRFFAALRSAVSPLFPQVGDKAEEGGSATAGRFLPLQIRG